MRAGISALILLFFFSTSDGMGCVPTGPNLVVNGDFSQGNVGFTSGYSYTNAQNGLLPAGSYAVGPDVSFYHPSAPGNIYDHTTGDPSGSYLMCNGISSANTSVWCQTISVTPNTDYNFSGWTTNWSPYTSSYFAEFQIIINGVALSGTDTTPHPNYIWQQFTKTWNSGSATSATICIVDLTTSANGNDFGIDDIKFQACLPTLTLVSSSTPTSCGLCNGTASVNASGGNGPYSFLWSSGATTQVATGLCDGTYIVTVTDIVFNSSTTSVTVVASNVITADIQISSKIQCNGQCNGTAMVSGNGGTLPYAYLWDNGQTDFIVTGLCAGAYQVTATDANNCTALTTVTITEPTVVTLAASSTPTGCTSPSGTATVSVSGGTSSYTYLWSDGKTTDITTSLASGNYTVTVIDANSCMDTASVTVTSLSAPTITVSSMTNITCYGRNDGSIAISASGSSPFIYSWSLSGGTNASASGLSAGIYVVTVTDSRGCIQTQSVTITEPPPLILNFKRDYYTCEEGSGAIQLNVSGGTSYSWLPTIGLSNPTIANPLATVVVNTTYTVTVYDGLCSDTAHVNIFLVPAPSPPTIFLSGDTLHVPQAYAVYQWYFNGYPAIGATDSIYIVTQNGTYAVMIYDSIGCHSLSNGILITEVNDLIDKSAIIIYPNPTRSSFIIRLNEEIEDFEVFIFDLIGKEIMREKIIGNIIEAEKGNLASGFYFVRVITGEKQYVQKIVVQ